MDVAPIYRVFKKKCVFLSIHCKPSLEKTPFFLIFNDDAKAFSVNFYIIKLFNFFFLDLETHMLPSEAT